MAAGLLPSHALLSLPSITPPRPRLAFSVSSSLHSSSLASSFNTHFLSAAASKRATLPVLRASSDEEPASVVVADDESSQEEETQIPKKPIVKLGDVMGILHKRAIEASVADRPLPDLRTGDIIEIKLEVPENRRRVSIYKGIVMSRQNAGIHTTIRVRRIIAGIGVEIVFPIYSPNVKEIKVVKHRKVRRARLYYLRDKLPRLSTFN
ncbi:large ribosomal subunit protein bL19cz-like [Wolffia australiana]